MVSTAVLAFYISCCGGENLQGTSSTDNNELSTDTDSENNDTDLSLTGQPCLFSTPRYGRLGEGLDVISALDPQNPSCQFQFQFAERLSDGSVAEIAVQGDKAEVYETPGFMIATLEFACTANSSGRCTADQGEVTLLEFEISKTDLSDNTTSGKRVRFEIDARGTKPGNTARFDGVIEGVIP